MATPIYSSSILLQDKFEHFNSRKLIINSPNSHQSLTGAPSPGEIIINDDLLKTQSAAAAAAAAKSFDANVVMILSVLLCALICSIGINSIIRCVMRRSRQVPSAYNAEHNTAGDKISANTGIRKKALKTLPTMKYKPDLKLPGLNTECAICLSEFASGERVRVLPKCNHGFHVRCIDKWLNSHSSCPTCRHCLIETCEKIVGCSNNSQATVPISLETIVISIAPLEPENLIHTYQS